MSRNIFSGSFRPGSRKGNGASWGKLQHGCVLFAETKGSVQAAAG